MQLGIHVIMEDPQDYDKTRALSGRPLLVEKYMRRSALPACRYAKMKRSQST
jgi:hypothetical protein